MLKKIFNTTLSVKEGASRSVLKGIIQYDALNEVNIRLSDGTKAFDYYGYTNIMFKVLKPDGTSYIDSEGENVVATSPEDGIVTVILKGQATAAAGLCQSVIEIYDGEDKMTSARLNYEVFEDLGVDETVESTTEYPVLQNLIADLSALEKRIEEAETQRVAAETKRVALETGYVARAEKAAEDAEMWAKASQGVAEGDFATRAELEAVEAGAAPAGYGLGNTSAHGPFFNGLNYNADGITGNGFFACSNGVPTKNWGMVMHQQYGSERAVQYFYPSFNSSDVISIKYDSVFMREKIYGVWGEWEYVNPPMYLGVEYRTTERYLGRPVYAKVVNFGALPNATEKRAAHGATNIDVICQFAVVAESGVETVTVNSAWFIDHCYANATEIVIKTNYDMGAWKNCYCTLKYTKTTDT